MRCFFGILNKESALRTTYVLCACGQEWCADKRLTCVEFNCFKNVSWVCHLHDPVVFQCLTKLLSRMGSNRNSLVNGDKIGTRVISTQ